MDYWSVAILLAETLNYVNRQFLGRKIGLDVVGTNIFGENVRRADLYIDSFIKGKLTEAGFSGVVISEEGNLFLGGNDCVYLDPLDGSLNYSRGLDSCGSLIGYSNNCGISGLVVGAFSTCNDDKVYFCVLGRGVYVYFSGRISEFNLSPRDRDKDVLIETGDTSGEALSWIRKFASIRHLGSIAYSFKLFLEGVLDGIVDVSGKLKLTDVAALKPFLDELGLPYKIDLFREEDPYNPRVRIWFARDKKILKKLISATGKD